MPEVKPEKESYLKFFARKTLKNWLDEQREDSCDKMIDYKITFMKSSATDWISTRSTRVLLNYPVTKKWCSENSVDEWGIGGCDWGNCPTLEMCKKEGYNPKFYADIVLTHKGHPVYFFIITDDKEEYFDKHLDLRNWEAQYIVTISPTWILEQTEKPEILKVYNLDTEEPVFRVKRRAELLDRIYDPNWMEK